MTTNYEQYMTRMVTPLGFQAPWFDAYFQAADGTWTAKLVVVAANAWNADQAAWLDRALSVPSTYTFVVRHESNDADTAPGVMPSAAIIAKHPLTLLLVGHTHTYEHRPAEREVIIGNGGAPLTSGFGYGYAIVARRDDGAIELDAYDYMTNARMDAWSVGADGLAR
jgi:glycine/D-amino acid oxidase-like deaminating enzyme